MVKPNDPLSRLVVDQDEVNRELLAELLADKVTIDPHGGTFAFKHRVRKELRKANVILIALLARKALVLLGAEVDETVKPRELEAHTGIRGGTLRPILKKLTDEGVVLRESGEYKVPNHSLEAVTDLLDKRGEQSEQ